MKIICDESMAKHKPIKFLFHLQSENRDYKSTEMLYGNCNKDCKNCICAMYPVDLVDKIEYSHMPDKKLKKGSASMSVELVKLIYG